MITLGPSLSNVASAVSCAMLVRMQVDCGRFGLIRGMPRTASRSADRGPGREDRHIGSDARSATVAALTPLSQRRRRAASARGSPAQEAPLHAPLRRRSGSARRAIGSSSSSGVVRARLWVSGPASPQVATTLLTVRSSEGSQRASLPLPERFPRDPLVLSVRRGEGIGCAARGWGRVRSASLGGHMGRRVVGCGPWFTCADRLAGRRAVVPLVVSAIRRGGGRAGGRAEGRPRGRSPRRAAQTCHA